MILVNGKPWPAMPVERRKYRFRILNASISRSYELALSTGDPFTVIGTDGGLMPAPQVAQTIRHGMAERYEVIVDFAKYPIGTRVVLRNLQPDNNREFPNTDVIMAFDVTSDATDTTDNEVPAVLNPNNATMNLQPSQAKTSRLMDFKRQGGEWTVNGRTWEDVINSGFTLLEAHPALNDVEIWTFRNNSTGGSIRSTSTSSTSRSSTATGARRRPTSADRRTSCMSARVRPCADHTVRPEPRPVHDALPQSRPRGPRHDGPVRGRRRRP